MILSISWKNVWRSKTRSLVVMIAVTLGLMGGILSVGVMLGMVEHRTSNALNNEISHLQIHHPKFKSNYESKYAIENVDEKIAFIKSISGVKSVSKRNQIMGMAGTSASSTGVMVNGIVPEQEMQVSQLYTTIGESKGNYFEKMKKNQIVIGQKLAKELRLTSYMLDDKAFEKALDLNIPKEVIEQLQPLKDKKFRKELDFENAITEAIGNNAKNYFFKIKKAATQVKLRKKIVLTFQDAEGVITGAAFRVTGVFSTSNGMYDGMNVFVRSDDLVRLSKFNHGSAQEIAIMCNSLEEIDAVKEKIVEKYPDLDVQTWKEISPELGMTSDMMEAMNYIIIIIILLALGFGIVNTMLMAILERVKELGMLMAIGMNRKRVFSMIMMETVFLTITGGIVGVILSVGMIQWLANVGLDLSSLFGEGLEAMGYSAVFYPKVTPDYYIGITLLVLVTGILASVYPARKALKLNPAEAVRSE